MSTKNRNTKSFKTNLITVSFIATLACICFLFCFFLSPTEKKEEKQRENGTSSLVSSRQEPEFVETTATVISTGDIMVHNPQLTGAYISKTGEYDFSSYFKETAPYFKNADLSVANLEVPFGGNTREYSGYPVFNCPDSLADTIKDSGLNLLLTSNNHSYDMGLSGLKRTAQVLKAKEIEFTGTKESESDPAYIIKTINNINIGIINYTYETTAQNSSSGKKYLNGILLNSEANNLINSFNYYKIEDFYNDIGTKITEMKGKGAEYIVVYIHWGNEYKTSPNTHQKSIAQSLCNMGVNMIIGSHPHVIQPVELIHSEDSSNTAICLYSMGNAVSNQRQELMSSCPSGHTEDGLLFEFGLRKTKDGVFLENLDLIPTWVNKYLVNGRYQYTIYPIENPDDLGKYNFNSTALAKARRSYARTKEIVAEGLTECQQFLGCEITFK